MFDLEMNMEQMDQEIAKLKVEQDLNAYRSQLADCRRRLLEIEKTKVAIVVRAKETEQKLREAEQLFETL
jgi:hypothetical protein